MQYDTAEYANNRLADTIVRLKDEPVYVHGVRENWKVDITPLGKGDSEVCNFDQLNLEPVPLGFCNTRRAGAVYVSRLPRRDDWRQGLRQNTIKTFPVLGEPISYEYLRQAIVGVQRPLLEAVQAAEGTGKPIAFHRHWAVTESSKLQYKWDIVGVVKADGAVSFKEEFAYLESRFMEDIRDASLSAS